MAGEKALPPGNEPKPDETLEVQAPKVGEQSETTRLERKKKLTLKQGETGEVNPGETVAVTAPGETQSTVLQDPARRRETNTASLKRLRPQDLQAPSETVAEDPDNTETVNIKVIKEQKKQFRNMMTSSQTLKVNPDGSPAETPSAEVSPRETIKVQAPETRTESITRMGAVPAETAAPAPAPSVEAPSPKSTLKIKAPPGVAPAQAGGGAAAAAKPGATLKIKAPAPAGGGDAVDPSARTVKQEAPAKAGKTLKLRQGAPAAEGGAAPAERARPSAPAAVPAAEESAGPGIVYTIISAASLVAVGVLIWKTVASSSAMFNQLF